MVNHFQSLYDEDEAIESKVPPILEEGTVSGQKMHKPLFIKWFKKNLQKVVSVLILIYLVVLIVNLLTCKESYITFELQKQQNSDRSANNELLQINEHLAIPTKDMQIQQREIFQAKEQEIQAGSLKQSDKHKDTQSLQKASNFQLPTRVAQDINEATENTNQNKLAHQILDSLIQNPDVAQENIISPNPSKIIVQNPSFEEELSSLQAAVNQKREKKYHLQKELSLKSIYAQLNEEHRSSIHSPTLEERTAVLDKYKPSKQLPLLLLNENSNRNLVRTDPDQEYYEGIQKQYISVGLPEKQVCVILSTRNNAFNSQIVRTLNSIYNQRYSEYQVVIADRSSNDDTERIVNQYLQSNKAILAKSKIIQTNQESEAYALWFAAQSCKDDSIAIYLDGNTELLGKEVFNILNHQFASSNPTIVYGSQYYYDVSQQKIKLFKAEKYDESETFLLLYRNLARKYGKMISFKTNTVKSIEKPYITFNQKYFSYSGIDSVALTLLEASCGKADAINLPLSFSLIDSQIENSEQKDRNHELHLITEQVKFDIC